MSTNIPGFGFAFNRSQIHFGNSQDVRHSVVKNEYQQDQVVSGQVAPKDAFNNYYKKDSKGQISQDAFKQFWGDALTDDAAKAIYANYDADGSGGLDEAEYARYQNEFSQSRRGTSGDSLASEVRATTWENEYNTAVQSGKVDYSKFSNFVANQPRLFDLGGEKENKPEQNGRLDINS